MTDLTKGIIEIDGFTITPETTLDEMCAFFGDKVRILELSTGPKLKFIKPFYISEDIYSRSFNFNKAGQLRSFSLIPMVPEGIVDDGYGNIPKTMLEISKRWFKNHIVGSNIYETEAEISATYQWGYVISHIYDTRDYGSDGGAIKIVYNGG